MMVTLAFTEPQRNACLLAPSTRINRHRSAATPDDREGGRAAQATSRKENRDRAHSALSDAALPTHFTVGAAADRRTRRTASFLLPLPTSSLAPTRRPTLPKLDLRAGATNIRDGDPCRRCDGHGQCRDIERRWERTSSSRRGASLRPRPSRCARRARHNTRSSAHLHTLRRTRQHARLPTWLPTPVEDRPRENESPAICRAFGSGPAWIRTRDQGIMSPLL
jgi:hypothetical protein